MTDLIKLRKEIKDGEYVVYKDKRNKIYIKDIQSEECIMICDLETIKSET